MGQKSPGGVGLGGARELQAELDHVCLLCSREGSVRREEPKPHCLRGLVSVRTGQSLPQEDVVLKFLEELR